jgi:hypothetical protein
MRQQVAASRADLEARVERDKSVEELELAYQDRFREALAQDAAARNWSLGKLASINRQYSAVRERVENSAKEYGELAEGRTAEQLSAKLIDQDVVAMRSQKLTEILQSGVAFRDRQAEISARMLNLNRESSMLAELSKAPSLKAQGLTLDGLAIAKRYEESVLAVESAASDRAAAERSMAALDTALKHYDGLLKTLDTSTLLRAASRNLNLAFVPYANEAVAQAGAPLYGCRFQLVVCRRVGRVKAVLVGEVVAKHPVYGSELRGNYVELEIEENAAMRQPVLHLGRRPLLF